MKKSALRACMDEIRKVLERHKVGGLVTLSSQTDLLDDVILPEWCAFRSEGNRMRFRMSPGEPVQKVYDSMNLLNDFNNAAFRRADLLSHALEHAQQELEFYFPPGSDICRDSAKSSGTSNKPSSNTSKSSTIGQVIPLNLRAKRRPN